MTDAEARATATGFGDIALRSKVNLLALGASGLAVIGELRLPTGREEDLLGTGETSFRTVVIGSSEVGRLAFHGNLGGTFGGLSDIVEYRAAVTVSAVSRLTLVGELLDARLAGFEVKLLLGALLARQLFERLI